MGGQLVFNWDRLENSLITRDRLVGNIVTNTKFQSWVGYHKVSVTPKSWFPRNNRKTYYNTAASAELAYRQPLQERHQRTYVTNQLMDNFYVLSGILIEKCFFKLSCQFNAESDAINQVTLGDQPVDAIDMFATLVYFSVSYISFG